MIIRSGENPKEALSKMGDGVLGHNWDPKLDMFSFILPVYLWRRKRDGSLSGPLLTPKNWDLLAEFVWSCRSVLATLARFYDPAGLLAVLTVKYKLFLHTLCQCKQLAWDSPLPKDKEEEWKRLEFELVHSAPLEIPRSARLLTPLAQPEMGIVTNGSLVAN